MNDIIRLLRNSNSMNEVILRIKKKQIESKLESFAESLSQSVVQPPWMPSFPNDEARMAVLRVVEFAKDQSKKLGKG